MSHLVYITLFGETDGVTLSRLDCTWRVAHINWTVKVQTSPYSYYRNAHSIYVYVH